MAKNYIVVVKNVFKSKDEETLREEYNSRWIELINRYERDKNRLLTKEQS